MQSFRCAAYNAEQGYQLVTAFSSFLSEVAALPPGDWDEDALLQFINERKEARLRKGWSTGPCTLTRDKQMTSSGLYPNHSLTHTHKLLLC